MSQPFINKCTNSTDLIGNDLRESHNLIVIKVKENVFVCLTRSELSWVLNIAGNNPPFLEQEFKNINEPWNWYYKLPYVDMYVNHTLLDLCKKQRNSMLIQPLLDKNKNKVVKTLFKSQGRLGSVHDQDIAIYEVIPLDRNNLYSDQKARRNEFELKGGDSEIVEEKKENIPPVISQEERKKQWELRFQHLREKELKLHKELILKQKEKETLYDERHKLEDEQKEIRQKGLKRIRKLSEKSGKPNNLFQHLVLKAKKISNQQLPLSGIYTPKILQEISNDYYLFGITFYPDKKYKERLELACWGFEPNIKYIEPQPNGEFKILEKYKIAKEIEKDMELEKQVEQLFKQKEVVGRTIEKLEKEIKNTIQELKEQYGYTGDYYYYYN